MPFEYPNQKDLLEDNMISPLNANCDITISGTGDSECNQLNDFRANDGTENHKKVKGE